MDVLNGANAHTAGVYGHQFDTRPHARLWIFSPRIYSNQAIRPIRYNFDGNFVDAADDVVTRRTSNNDGIRLSEFVKNPTYMGAIVPQARADHLVNMGVLQYAWTFTLVVTNDNTSPTNSSLQRRMSGQQDIYSGYFTDEPVNPILHSGQYQPNPNAALVITHRTTVGRTTVVGINGTRTLSSIMNDFDVIHPAAYMTQASTNANHLLRPGDLVSSVVSAHDSWMDDGSYIPGGNSVWIPDPVSTLTHLEGPVNLHSRLSIPRSNVSNILDSIAQAKRTLNLDTLTGHPVVSLGKDALFQLVEDGLRTSDTCRVSTGLDTNAISTLGSIITRYNPTINVLRQDKTPQYQPIVQEEQTARNVFSALLTSIVPPIMLELLLCEISFMYDSYTQHFNFGEHYATLTAMPQTETRCRLESFKDRMTREIFPILAAAGDFRLQMTCSAGGTTGVSLNYYDEVRTPEVYEVPTIFGGMSSPVIGGGEPFEANAHELSSLIKILTHDDSDRPPPLSQYDDQRLIEGISKQISHSGESYFGDVAETNKWNI